MLVECPNCDALNVWSPGAHCEDCGHSLDPDFHREDEDA